MRFFEIGVMILKNLFRKYLFSLISLSLLNFLLLPLTYAQYSFVEVGGKIILEAEEYSSRKASFPQSWFIVPTEYWIPYPTEFNNYSGTGYVQALPEKGIQNSPNTTPIIDYKLKITQTGTYRLLLRWDSFDEGSNALYARILEKGDGLGGVVSDWYMFTKDIHDRDFATNPWDKLAFYEGTSLSLGNSKVTPTWQITQPGEYTLRIEMAKDGAALDALAFQLDNLPDPDPNNYIVSPIISKNIYKVVAKLDAREVWGLATKDNFAYVLQSGALRYGGLSIFNLSNIPNINEFRSIDPIAPLINIDDGRVLLRNGNYLYVGGNGISIMDISESSSPKFLNFISTYGTVNSFIVFGEYLIICTDANRIEVLSLNNPGSPVKVGSLNLTASSLATYNNHLYCGYRDNLYVIDIEDPSNLKIINTIKINVFYSFHMKIVKNKLVISGDAGGIGVGGIGGVVVCDLSTPNSPSCTEGEFIDGGRVFALERNYMIFSESVYTLDGLSLNFQEKFDPHEGGQGSGFPYGSAVTYLDDQAIILLGQWEQALVLRGPLESEIFTPKGDIQSVLMLLLGDD
jgi:hypothetical protein